MSKPPDETWRVLREWTYGQTQSERLAGQILLSEGYKDFDPSHPLGGKDGGKDALATKDGKMWVMAVHFPTGPVTFAATKRKFSEDLPGVAQHGAYGIVFVTNQEISLADRAALKDMAGKAKAKLELYHLERITAILDQPSMAKVREQFLFIPAEAEPKGPAVFVNTNRWTYESPLTFNSPIVAPGATNSGPVVTGGNPMIMSGNVANQGSNIFAPNMMGGQVAHEIRNEGLQPRRISPAAEGTLLARLRRVSARFKIRCVMGDAEPVELAKHLQDLLRRAGWTQIGDLHHQLLHPPPSYVQLLSPMSADTTAIKELGGSILDAGVYCFGAYDERVTDLEILVAHNRPPPKSDEELMRIADLKPL
jgi:hypothetical protein